MSYHSTLGGNLGSMMNSRDTNEYEDIFEKLLEIRVSEWFDKHLIQLQRDCAEIGRPGFASSSKLIRYLPDIYEDSIPIKLLGSGSYGYAFLVKYCDQPAVMKVTKIKNGRPWSMGEEASVLHKLNGAGGLPKLFAVSVSGDVMIMSHIKGMSFKDIMFSVAGVQHLFNVSDTVPYFLSVFQCLCVAVDEVHTAGYVHNDLHFGNIMVQGGYDGKPIKVTLVDVGMATPPGTFTRYSSTSSARKYGKNFSAKELFAYHMTFPSSDVFSIGWLLKKTTETTRLKYCPEISTLVASMMRLNFQERITLDEAMEFLHKIQENYISLFPSTVPTPTIVPTPTTTSSPPPHSLDGGVSLVLHNGGTLTLPGGDVLILPAGTKLKIPGGCRVNVQKVHSIADGLVTSGFIGVGNNSTTSQINSPHDSPPMPTSSSSESLLCQSLTLSNKSPEGLLGNIMTTIVNVTRAIINLPWWAL